LFIGHVKMIVPYHGTSSQPGSPTLPIPVESICENRKPSLGMRL
jgi:hypothetical protein